MKPSGAAPYGTVALVTLATTLLPPTNDAGWQMWIGQQILEGAGLYTDIVEINPPLWFWLAAPLAYLAKLTGCSSWTVLVTFLGASTAFSLWLTRCRLWPIVIFAVFAVSLGATGQREQFALIAVVPYVFLAADRAAGAEVSKRHAIVIGVWAAFGIALKPYFALAPLALESWLLIRHRRIRPEFVVMLACGGAYSLAVLLLTPDYLSSVVPLALNAYDTSDNSLEWMLKTSVTLTGAVGILGLVLARNRPPLMQALAISGMAFLLSYLLQMKGFRYQGLPALGLFTIMAFSDRMNVLLALVPVLALAGTLERREVPKEQAYLCSLPPGTSVAVLAPYGDFAWPAVEQCKLTWASRYMFLWMLQKPDSATGMQEAVTADIKRYRPDVVLVSKPGRMGDPLNDKRIHSALRDYIRVGDTPYAVVFRPKREFNANGG